MTAYLAFPYQIDAAGHTATADLPTYVETLVLLVLDTSPGERVNRPTFGAGLKTLLFEGMNSALAAAAETMVRGKLMQFLADVITIQSLKVAMNGEALEIALTYTITASAEQVSQRVTQSLPGTVSGTPTLGTTGGVPSVTLTPRSRLRTCAMVAAACRS